MRRRQPPFGPSGDMIRSVRTRRRRRLRRWQWIALAVVAVLGALAGYVVWLYYDTQNEIQVVIDDIEERDDEGSPYNVLLVGSDSRAGLSAEERIDLGAGAVPGERADTIVLAHVDPDTDHITMVQFPRDLEVRIPGRGKDKINAALGEGAGSLVATVESLTGLQVDHYAQIDLAGFKDLVDAIGGVDVCVPEAVPFDPSTGLRIADAGIVHFDGDLALRYVRSRKAFGSDFERIANQQRFLAAAIDKITSVETLLHLSRIRRLLSIAGEHLRVDQYTSALDLYRLGARLDDFDPDDYEAYVVPNRGVGASSSGSIVVPDPRAMRVMFGALEDNRSPAEADGVPGVDPATISVGVYNATGQEGRAERAARLLRAATGAPTGGLSIDDIANAPRSDLERSVIRYSRSRPESRRMAALVGAALPQVRIEAGATAPGIDVAVMVGRRFEVRRVVQILPLPLPRAGDVPPACRD